MKIKHPLTRMRKALYRKHQLNACKDQQTGFQ